MSKVTQAGGDVYRMPYEGNDTSISAAEESLFAQLASDPDVGDETTEEENGPVPAEEAEEPSNEAGEEPDEEEEDEDVEADEDDEEEPAEEAPSTFKVKVDGEEVEVTLDELLSGYSRTSDYTRKTQAVAEERKRLEAEAATTRQAREQYGQLLGQLEAALASTAPAEPDWDKLRQQNPAEFAAQWADHQRRSQEMHAVRSEMQRVAQEMASDQQTQLRTLLENERQRLVEAIPEWQDSSKAAEEKKQLASYAKEKYGFSDAELGQVYDHRVMLILRKAAKYDEISTKGAERVREKSKTAKVLQPGARTADAPQKGKTAKRKRAMDRLARTGRTEDAAAAILTMLGEND